MKRFVGLFAIFVTLAPCGAVALAQPAKKSVMWEPVPKPLRGIMLPRLYRGCASLGTWTDTTS